jgi:nitroreductase
MTAAHSFSPTAVLTALNWRYAVKKFDPARKIPVDTWAALEQSLVLSPSSYGLQPWKFFVVETPSVREQLLPHSWGQRQVVDASHLVVFAVKKDVGPADAERLVSRSAAVRGIPVEKLAGYKNMMVGSLTRGSAADIDVWMSRQVFIALGVFLTTAAVLGVDACPMEGFVPEKYDELLGLAAKGYAARVAATAGYRAADDPNAALAKVRFPVEEVVERV